MLMEKDGWDVESAGAGAGEEGEREDGYDFLVKSDWDVVGTGKKHPDLTDPGLKRPEGGDLVFWPRHYTSSVLSISTIRATFAS